MRLDQVLQKTNLGSLTSNRTSSSTFLLMRAVINAKKHSVTLKKRSVTLRKRSATLEKRSVTLKKR